MCCLYFATDINKVSRKVQDRAQASGEKADLVYVHVQTIATAVGMSDMARSQMELSSMSPNENLFISIACLSIAFKFHETNAEFPIGYAVLWYEDRYRKEHVQGPLYSRTDLRSFEGKVLMLVDCNIHTSPHSIEWLFSSQLVDNMPEECLKNVLHATLSSLEVDPFTVPSGGASSAAETAVQCASLAKVSCNCACVVCCMQTDAYPSCCSPLAWILRLLLPPS